MVQWASDNLGVSSEIDQLGQVFTYVYNCEVSILFLYLTISHPLCYPQRSSNSGRSCSGYTRYFTAVAMAAEKKAATKVTGPRELLSLAFAWKYRLTSNRTKPSGSPTMPTGCIQTLLEESRSDAILIYDSCCSADTAMIESTLNGITELMTACRFQTTAPGVGPTLFFLHMPRHIV